MTKIAGSGSISQRHGSADPDPHQNVMDPQHWLRHCPAHLELTAIEELWDGGGRIAPEPAGAADTNCPPHRLHQPAFKIKGTVVVF